MPLPARFRDPGLWLGLQVDTIYAAYADGQIHPQTTDKADAVYQPSSVIPSFVFCRISDSEKRLEQAVESRPVMNGSWGVLHEVLGQGTIIGAAFAVNVAAFSSAHVLPDMVHLVSMVDDVPHDSIMKGLYEHKTFRSFRLGPMGDDQHPHDLLVTTKTRWFRNRNNPKFLGFSKDDKS
jgi:hypothetical protein